MTLAQRLILIALLAMPLGACQNLQRLSEIGRAPPMSPIENPSEKAKPVTLPMPQPEIVVNNANSLWRPGARSFFKDQRAQRIGDILTVNIEIGDKATVSNSTSRSRTAGEEANVSNLLGIESQFAKVLPEAVDPDNLANLGSSSTHAGSGSVDRSEDIELVIAAIVTQILPNGNLVIQGRQEVRVNNELRELTITGVVRPEDITNSNTIEHTQIAEARISYGGRGDISDMQRPRYGQQIYELVFPF